MNSTLHFRRSFAAFLSSILISLSLAFGPLPEVSAAYPVITIEGETNDWMTFAPVYTGNTTLASMKSTNDSTNLYVLLTGGGMNMPIQLYFNTDFNQATGYQSANWTGSTGFDMLLEGTMLFSYSGSGTNWSWQAVGNVGQFVESLHAVREIAVPLASLGVSPGAGIQIAAYNNGPSAGQEMLPGPNEPSRTVTLLNSNSDTAAPSTPSGLSASALSSSRVQLQWTASSDNRAVTGYSIYRDSKFVGYAVGTNYTDKLLEPDTTYVYSVKAHDAQGNLSSASVSASSTTLSAPNLPASTGNWQQIRNSLVNYVDEDRIDPAFYAQHDVVMMSSFVSMETVSAIKALNPDIFLIAYTSLGQFSLHKDANGQTRDFYFLDSSGNPIKDPAWPSYYVDARKPDVHAHVLDKVLPEMFAKGFDGAFLDTIDVCELTNYPYSGLDFTPSKPGMIDLIQKIKQKFPDKKFIANGGSSFVADIQSSIDGMMAESQTSTWLDGSEENYHIHPFGSFTENFHKERISALNQARFQFETGPSGTTSDGRPVLGGDHQPVRKSNFFHVFALDYALPGQKEIMQFDVDEAWAFGLIPSIGIKELYLPQPYDWLNDVELPSDQQFGRKIGLPPEPVVDYNATNQQYSIDWTQVQASWSGTGDVQLLKVYGDTKRQGAGNFVARQDQLFLRAEGNNMGSYRMFVLDVDRNPNTGYQFPQWSQPTGADYMIEAGMLYRYTGSGSNWSWASVRTVNQVNTTQSTTVQVPIGTHTDHPNLQGFVLHPHSQLRIGYMINYSGGGSLATLPNTNTPLVDVQLNGVAIDGWSDDWASIPYNEYKNTGSLRGLSLAANGNTLLASVHGTGLNVHGNFFLNTDNNLSTGYTLSGWQPFGADYMLENNILYRYTGTNNSWHWTSIGTVPYVRNYRLVEAAIPLNQLGGLSAAATIKAGYMLNFSSAEVLPAPGKSAKPFVLGAAWRMNGESDEWTGLAPLMTGTGRIQNVTLANDASNLYMRLSGQGLHQDVRVYLDADASGLTGYQPAGWTNALGAEYLIENGTLWRYTGTGSNWSWQLIDSAVNAQHPDVHELAVPLDALNVNAGNTLRIGVVRQQSVTDRLPASNVTFASYTVN